MHFRSGVFARNDEKAAEHVKDERRQAMVRDSPGEWLPFTNELDMFLKTIDLATWEAMLQTRSELIPSVFHYRGEEKSIDLEEVARRASGRRRALYKALKHSARPMKYIFLHAHAAKLFHTMYG